MEFPFDIYQVAEQLGLEMKRQHPKSADYNCPFCDGNGKLNLNISLNAYRCNKCGEHGGMIDLFCKCTGMTDRKRAYQILSEHNGHFFSAEVRKDRQTAVKTIREVPKADIGRLDFCYSAMLGFLELKPQHRQNLISRGLSDSEIDFYQYRSVPTEYTDRLVAVLLERGCDLIGVPGFYADENGEIKLNLHSCMGGFFVPVYNECRQIQGLQIRLDTHLDGNRKYMWMSSAERNGGCSSNSPVGISGDVFNSEVVYVTEGPLKGQIAHALSGKPFLATAGVNQQKELEAVFSKLKENGKCRMIIDAFDMDDGVNPHVRRGHINLAWLAEKYGFIPRRVTWNNRYKGIDDYLLACKGKRGASP